MKVELNWKIIVAFFILLSSTFITASKILENPEITISINNRTVEFEKEQKIYLFNDIILVSATSILLGFSLMYLFILSLSLETTKKSVEMDLFNDDKQKKWKEHLETLTGDEKEIYKIIYDAKGEILQKDIILSNFSRSKVTRLLDYLEKSGLIERKSYGMTNKVVLK